MILLLSFHLGCAEAPPPPPPAAPPPPGPAPAPFSLDPGPESPLASWRAELAVEVPALTSVDPCPDADGDGFVSALACPDTPPELADCDDDDPLVTPATERWVRPGPFLMGSISNQAGRDEGPVEIVQLSGYCLDRTELSTGDFARLAKAGLWTPQGSALLPSGEAEAGRERFPAEGLSYEDARFACQAQGKRLPTEAQWEKAARGGCELGTDPSRCDAGDLRPYPWGEAAPSCALANHNSTASGRPSLCASDTLPVDALPEGAGPYGHLHLAGNVWEYTADTWHPAIYRAGRTDPAGPPGGQARALRGGSWNTFSTNMRVANRFHDLVMGSATGVRCVRAQAQPVHDDVPPLAMSTVRGQVRAAGGALEGRALYVTAFDAADADPRSGAVAPGRSPVAELRLLPQGEPSQPFEIELPAGSQYILMSSLDNGTGGDKASFIASSGSGGFGRAASPVQAREGQTVEGVEIVLNTPPRR